MLNIEPKLDALLLDPVTTSKFIDFFDKEIKKRCIEKSEFFAQTLIHDEDASVRQICALNYEFLALNLIEDESSTVRLACAEKWESCARHLYQDDDVSVRCGCLNWESCFPLILQAGEEDTDIRRIVALALISAEDLELRSLASEILQYEIEEDEDFANECMESDEKQLRLLCAEFSRDCALKLVHSTDDDLVEISIQRLLEDNDWYCLGSEELVDLCHIDERLAEVILDNHLDDWWVKSACVQLYESCAVQLMTDEEDVIAEHAQFVILESNNQALKLKAIQDSYNHYQNATVLIADKDPEVRKACIDVDEDFAQQLIDDPDMDVRLACLEYEDCVDDLVNDVEPEIRKACARYYHGAVQLLNDEDPEVRRVCAGHYQCALGMINDINEEVRSIAKITVETNRNLDLPFD